MRLLGSAQPLPASYCQIQTDSSHTVQREMPLPSAGVALKEENKPSESREQAPQESPGKKGKGPVVLP